MTLRLAHVHGGREIFVPRAWSVFVFEGRVYIVQPTKRRRSLRTPDGQTTEGAA